MDTKEILNYCVNNGLLIDTGLLNLLSGTNDTESAKLIIEKLRDQTQKRIITKTLFEQNKEKISQFFLTLPQGGKRDFEKLRIKLGLEIEISNESTEGFHEESSLDEASADIEKSSVSFLPGVFSFKKKIEVGDFVANMKDRFNKLRGILQEHGELENLISINKLTRGKKSSIIGIVYSKSVTKNRNILLEVEDLTGRTKVLINQNKPEIYQQAEDICLDSVLGFSGSGDREIFFANNIIFPDATLYEKKHSPVEEYAVFVGDIHYGSKLFMEDKFLNFIDYLNGNKPNTPEVEKIKYLFLVGDLVSGVGVYPSQNVDLLIDDLEEQFQGFAKILKTLRKDIKIIISPGNHDGVRLLEPQPALDEKYAWPIYNMENVILTGNPASVKIGETEGFAGFDILTYHGFSYPFYSNNIPSLIEGGLNAPDKIMTYLLRHRHLAPTYSSSQYIPLEDDKLFIKDVPDIFVSGHTHKCAVSSYNNVLIVSVASWESKTEFQEKMGNKPDFCKVPLFNLKTRAIKILDFE